MNILHTLFLDLVLGQSEGESAGQLVCKGRLDFYESYVSITLQMPNGEWRRLFFAKEALSPRDMGMVRVKVPKKA